MADTKNYTIFSFQRTGSHFLEQILLHNLGTISKRTHHFLDNVENQIVLSLARDPLFAITSSLSQFFEFDSNDIDNDLERQVDRFKGYYVVMCDEMLSKSDLVVSFDEMVNNTNSIIDKLSTALGINIISRDLDKFQIVDRRDRGFVKTSKGLSQYRMILNAVKSTDLSEACTAYNKMLKACI